MKTQGNFYQTTALVTFFGVAERALGFLYRIVLARLLGAEGLGVYQIALSHFALFRTLGGGGLPVTTSRLVAKDGAQKTNTSGGVLAAATLLSLAITLPLTLLFCLLGSTESTLKILLIGLPFTCVYAVVKGFFWGKNHFLVPALLEMGEEVIGVLFGVLLLRFFYGNCTTIGGANIAATACVIACILSAILAFFLLFIFPKKERTIRLKKAQIKEVAFAAAPITAMRVGSTLLSSIVALLFPAMLVKAGMSSTEATAAFGVVTGMAFPLLSMPMTLVGSFALVLMPKLAEDYYQGHQKRLRQNVERGLTCAVFIACLLLPFFVVFGENIGLLTYKNALSGELLKNCAPLLLPLSFCLISNTALNSMGFEKKTLFSYLVGAAAMLLCVLLLPAKIGVYAYAVGLLFEYVVSAAINTFFLFKHCKPSKFFLRKLCLSLLFCLPVLALGKGLYTLVGLWLGGIGSMIVSGVAMCLLSFLLYGTFGLVSLPFFRKILSKR